MNLFLSSTFADLRDERKAVLDLTAPGHFMHGMELFPADPDSALKVALRNLHACDAMLLIIGFKAGSVIPGRRGLTYTRAEFEFAQRWDIPLFAFVRTEDGRWRNDETESERHDTLDRFKADVETAVKPDYFGNRDELQRQVVEALTGWEARGRPGARKLFAEHQEHFKKPLVERPLFDYDQVLRGRTEQIRELNQFLASVQNRVAVLLGRGGIGKSKLLHDWTQSQRDWQVLFLKERATWHSEAAKEIPEGKVLIVVDDAHQAENLEKSALVIRELTGKHTVKLLLSLRPSGAPLAESVLSRCFDPQKITNIPELQQLAEKEVRELAEEVLGPDNRRYVDYLTAISKDAPLVTVVGGRLIATRSIDPHLLTGTEEFRRAVFGKFLQEIEFAFPTRSIDFRSILHLVSAVGPISWRSEPILSVASAFLQIRSDEFLYGIDTLERQGIIVRRGYTQRVAPDVLSDYLLEERCLNKVGESTGYAEHVYHSFRDTALTNVLRNLAELDWRITRQTPSASLLDQIWQAITEEFKSSGATGRMTLLQHIKPASAYQPRPVMQLLRIAMDAAAPVRDEDGVYSMGHEDVLRQIPHLLGSIAYHPEFTEEAVQRLWQLAVADKRPTNQFPKHAIRVLVDLASYGRFKPVSFNVRMGEILDRLVDEPGAFAGEATPLDIVNALLKRDGEFTETVGLTFHIGGFELAYDVVKPVRECALAIVDKCLYSENGRKATRAVKAVADVIHGWIPAFGRPVSDAERKWQQEERLAALSLLKRRLSITPIAMPLVREIYRTMDEFLRWAHEGAVTHAVKEICDSIRLEGELFEFHMLCTAPHDYHRDNEDWADSQKNWEADLKDAECSMENRIADSELRVDELLRLYSLAE